LRLLRLEHADELVPLAALGVEDLEIIPPTGLEVLLLEGLLRLAILRVEREDLLPRIDRGLVVVEALAVQRGELAEDDLLRLHVGGDLGLLLQDLGELLPVLLPLVKARERIEGLRVLGVVGDDLVPELDADLGLLDALGRELRDLEELRAARA